MASAHYTGKRIRDMENPAHVKIFGDHMIWDMLTVSENNEFPA